MNNSPVHAFPTRDRRPDALGDLKLLPDELICAILEYLSPRDVARLSCVSSVMYILCNEEPLWMILCVRRLDGPLKYKGSWKKTTLCLESAPNEYQEQHGKSVEFNGFSSLFLYRRLYRCHTTLNGFAFDHGNVDRKANISLEEFNCQYDGKKPVLLSGLADTWPARKTWTIEQLSQEYGDTVFRISQRSPKNFLMKFKDYVSYMNLQHDEDPLYIFDDKFGETAPSLLKDFSVPYLFQEDFFEVLDRDDRPPFRWLIIGPERSGASWHVDPALTSAWNTLLCGRKRWALYPPGRVPLGVTVHVNDEDGDVNIDTPSSLQWWLDFYPLLADEDKPVECIQQPGETIFVPSGWWHCVLNLEPTVAVTQNFVNRKNFEYVCLDMAPGYRHKGVCRAGLLALDGGSFQNAQMNKVYNEDVPSYPDLTRKEKRIKMQNPREVSGHEATTNDSPKSYDLVKPDFYYDIEFLSTLLHEERDHYNSPWSSGNCIGPREMRGWLSRLWVEKPGMRELTWKGACLALNAERWLGCLTEICSYHNLPCPSDDERLPVGTGSNPVYLVAGFAVKIFVEGGLEASMYNLGTELEFYSMLCKSSSALKNHVPEVVASGILYLESGTLRIVPWDGKGVPNVICDHNLILKCNEGGFPFDVWRKKHLEYKKAGLPFDEQFKSSVCAPICPFVITKRCKGKIFAELRDTLSWEEAVNLASFLGKQLHNLHVLPYPPFDQPNLIDIEQKEEMPFADAVVDDNCCKPDIPEEWRIFVSILSMRRKNLISRLTNWGDPIPKSLIEKVDVYLPDDFTKLFVRYENDGLNKLYKDCSWIHTDIMDDNVYMEPQIGSSCSNGNAAVTCLVECGSTNGCVDGSKKSWHPSYIIDFSDLSIGDRIYDIIPIYLDIFRGDSSLLKQFLESYKLPLIRRNKGFIEDGDKYKRLSYHTMCYCILHDENILGAIFSIWKELRAANSWEEVELTVWGELNNYQYSS